MEEQKHKTLLWNKPREIYFSETSRPYPVCFHTALSQKSFHWAYKEFLGFKEFNRTLPECYIA